MGVRFGARVPARLVVELATSTRAPEHPSIQQPREGSSRPWVARWCSVASSVAPGVGKRRDGSRGLAVVSTAPRDAPRQCDGSHGPLAHPVAACLAQPASSPALATSMTRTGRSRGRRATGVSSSNRVLCGCCVRPVGLEEQFRTPRHARPDVRPVPRGYPLRAGRILTVSGGRCTPRAGGVPVSPLRDPTTAGFPLDEQARPEALVDRSLDHLRRQGCDR
jgi:hypothetical protein